MTNCESFFSTDLVNRTMLVAEWIEAIFPMKFNFQIGKISNFVFLKKNEKKVNMNSCLWINPQAFQLMLGFTPNSHRTCISASSVSLYCLFYPLNKFYFLAKKVQRVLLEG